MRGQVDFRQGKGVAFVCTLDSIPLEKKHFIKKPLLSSC
jgi:hypothetical protein